MATKFIFVTGGVVSGLGKGITAAALGRLLKARGLTVRNQKFDPYLNIDPGIMSPTQHGEVFITEDGAETDLDIGHYERFTDENLGKESDITSGMVYGDAILRERKGFYMGTTVQVVPHIINEIKEHLFNISRQGTRMSSSPKLAEPLVTWKGCPISRRSASSVTMSAKRMCFTSM